MLLSALAAPFPAEVSCPISCWRDHCSHQLECMASHAEGEEEDGSVRSLLPQGMRGGMVEKVGLFSVPI